MVRWWTLPCRPPSIAAVPFGCPEPQAGPSHGTLSADGKRQDLVVRHRACRSTSVLNGQDVVTQPRKLLDDREGEVLVRIQSRQSGVLILSDVAIDLLLMGTHVRPCVGQVLGPECGLSAQQLGLACAEPSGLLQNPDRYPGSYDAGLPAADRRAALDSGKSSRQLWRSRRRRGTCAMACLHLGIHRHANSPAIMAATRSPIIITVELVLLRVTSGITEASTTRNPWMPCTRQR